MKRFFLYSSTALLLLGCSHEANPMMEKAGRKAVGKALTLSPEAFSPSSVASTSSSPASIDIPPSPFTPEPARILQPISPASPARQARRRVTFAPALSDEKEATGSSSPAKNGSPLGRKKNGRLSVGVLPSYMRNSPSRPRSATSTQVLDASPSENSQPPVGASPYDDFPSSHTTATVDTTDLLLTAIQSLQGLHKEAIEAHQPEEDAASCFLTALAREAHQRSGLKQNIVSQLEFAKGQEVSHYAVVAPLLEDLILLLDGWFVDADLSVLRNNLHKFSSYGHANLFIDMLSEKQRQTKRLIDNLVAPETIKPGGYRAAAQELQLALSRELNRRPSRTGAIIRQTAATQANTHLAARQRRLTEELLMDGEESNSGSLTDITPFMDSPTSLPGTPYSAMEVDDATASPAELDPVGVSTPPSAHRR